MNFISEPENEQLSQDQALLVSELAASLKQAVFQMSTGNYRIINVTNIMLDK